MRGAEKAPDEDGEEGKCKCERRYKWKYKMQWKDARRKGKRRHFRGPIVILRFNECVPHWQIG